MARFWYQVPMPQIAKRLRPAAKATLPSSVRHGEPTPPDSAVPPITAMAIAVSS